MSELFDFPAALQDFLEVVPQFLWGSQTDDEMVQKPVRRPIDNTFFKVRDSVCVAGYHRDTVNDIKRRVGTLLDEPFPIESFHVKTPGDLKDGALLVPKIILVARHCPGLKLLDDEEDRGQLDLIYDEVCEMEADVMIIYAGLPRTLYKPMRHMVYHPKTADTLFPNQPLLKALAADNCFVTIIEDSELTNMQKNVIREWLTKPVNSDHPVYKVADYLSSVEVSTHTNGYGSSAARIEYYSPPSNSRDHDPYDFYGEEPNFTPATEEHPLADKKSKKKKRKDKKEKKSKKRSKDHEGSTEMGGEDNQGLELNPMKYNFSNPAHAYDDFV